MPFIEQMFYSWCGMRDDFSRTVIQELAKRVCYRCSNPKCRRPTSGPHSNPSKSVNIGVAAHITAASPKGARYDPTITSQQRSSIDNGMWLCQVCGALIDRDEDSFPVSMLRSWKQQAERDAFSAIEGFLSNYSHIFPQNLEDGGVLRYIILGINDLSLHPWLSIFSDKGIPDDLIKSSEEVYFGDITEMQSVLADLRSSADDAPLYGEKLGIGKQEAFERLVMKKGISRTAQRLFAKSEQVETTSELAYVIYGIRPDHITTIQALNPYTLLSEQSPIVRYTEEIFFSKPSILSHIPQTINKVVQSANGDNEKFWQLLFEAAMNLKTFGPE